MQYNYNLKLIIQARPLLSEALDTEDFGELVDPRLGLNFNENEMFRMIEAAAACVRHSAAKRPRMGQVLSFDRIVLFFIHFISLHRESLISSFASSYASLFLILVPGGESSRLHGRDL